MITLQMASGLISKRIIQRRLFLFPPLFAFSRNASRAMSHAYNGRALRAVLHIRGYGREGAAILMIRRKCKTTRPHRTRES